MLMMLKSTIIEIFHGFVNSSSLVGILPIPNDCRFTPKSISKILNSFRGFIGLSIFFVSLVEIFSVVSTTFIKLIWCFTNIHRLLTQHNDHWWIFKTFTSQGVMLCPNFAKTSKKIKICRGFVRWFSIL